jgi:hypothetical protein
VESVNLRKRLIKAPVLKYMFNKNFGPVFHRHPEPSMRLFGSLGKAP